MQIHINLKKYIYISVRNIFNCSHTGNQKKCKKCICFIYLENAIHKNLREKIENYKPTRAIICTKPTPQFNIQLSNKTTVTTPYSTYKR